MSDPADDRDGKVKDSVPPPSSWVPAESASEPVDEWVVDTNDDPATPPAGPSPEAPAPVADDLTPPPAGVPPPAPTAVEPSSWLPQEGATDESAEPEPAAGEAAPSWSAPVELSPTRPSERSLVDVPAPLTGAPRVPRDEPDVEAGVAPALDEPADTTAFVHVPDEAQTGAELPAAESPAAELAPEPLPAGPEFPASEPVEAPIPGVRDDEPLTPAAVTEPEPLPPIPAPDPTPPIPPDPIPEPTPFPEPVPEPTPTAFETVTDPIFTSEPEPAAAFAAEQSTPDTTAKVASIAAEHPEYLIAAALIGGFVLAKVVKKLAS